MRILVVHNRYGKFSGEESVVDAQVKLLVDDDHEVMRFERSSTEIRSVYGKIKAFFTGIYNPSSARQLRQLLKAFCPDIVHIHNLFPFISPGILPECKKAGIPVVMSVHNYRLTCPNGLHLTRGQICEKCCNGREWWCVLRNCERNIFKSLGYALRHYIARKLYFFLDNVTMYACLTAFQKRRLIDAGFSEDRIAVLPNTCSVQVEESSSEGDYVGFVGRVSPEKGVDILLQSAEILDTVSFNIAGDCTAEPGIDTAVSSNVKFCGFLQGKDLDMFRRRMRIGVMPSLGYETFGLILAEAALYGKPVIASRLGAMAEIVEDGKTGLLFEPGNAKDLARKIKTLWNDPELCRRMGEAGRQKTLREYSPEKYYERLMECYQKAIEFRK